MTEFRASEHLENYVDFWDASKVIIGSAGSGNPPIGFIGDNGIRKTESLVTVQKLFKNSIILRFLDYGGIKANYSKGTFDGKATVFLSDIQNILNRKFETQNSTLSMLASMVEPQSFVDVDFQGIELDRRYKAESNFHRMNIIFAGTPRHLDILARNTRAYDFLSRFAFLNVKRESNSEEMQSEFRLKYVPNAEFKIDVRPLEQKDGENSRHYQIRKYMTSICMAMEISELTYYVFNPETKGFDEIRIDVYPNPQRWKNWYHLIVRRA